MLATLTVGDVVGEISMVLRRAASADVVAIHPTLAFEINQEQLAHLMRKYPPLLVELYDLATRRDDEVRAASEDAELIADDDVVLV
jgi:CRP-like cAMP-binding protein